MANLRPLIPALLLALSLQCWAADTNLRFDRISVYELCRLVYGDILSESYILDESLATGGKVASLDVRAATDEQVRRVLEIVLSSSGYSVRREGELNIVERAKVLEPRQSVFSYVPKFRRVGYLQAAVRSFVTKGRFAGATSAVTSAPAAPQLGQPMAQQYQQQAQPAQAGQTVTQIVPGGAVSVGNMDVLLFQGEDADVELVKSLVAELDVPARELVVRATVFEVQTAESDSSAVQLALKLLRGKITAAYGFAGEPATGRIAFGDFEAAVSLLAQDSRFKLVSSPSLRVTSGDTARVSIGADVPVLGAVTVPANGAPVQSVQYQSSGVIFDIRPVALRESVQVALTQQISNFTETTNGVNASPTLLKRELVSSVGVRPGEVVLLGGLDETSDTRSGSGLPFLPRWLWSRSASNARTELVIILKVDVLEQESNDGERHLAGADRGSKAQR